MINELDLFLTKNGWRCLTDKPTHREYVYDRHALVLFVNLVKDEIDFYNADIVYDEDLKIKELDYLEHQLFTKDYLKELDRLGYSLSYDQTEATGQTIDDWF